MMNRAEALIAFKSGKIDDATLEAILTGRSFAAEPSQYQGVAMIRLSGPFRPKNVSAKMVRLIVQNGKAVLDACDKADAMAKS